MYPLPDKHRFFTECSYILDSALSSFECLTKINNIQLVNSQILGMQVYVGNVGGILSGITVFYMDFFKVCRNGILQGILQAILRYSSFLSKTPLLNKRQETWAPSDFPDINPDL